MLYKLIEGFRIVKQKNIITFNKICSINITDKNQTQAEEYSELAR